MSLKDVAGQSAAVKSFLRLIRDGRLAHAYILAGPEGVGKFLFARQLAKALHCVSPSSGDSCDVCRNCANIDSDVYPFVNTVRLKAGSQKVKVEDIQQLIKGLSMKTFSEKQWNILIIDDAEELSIQGYNALLKTIEEPPPRILIILVCSRMEALPSTVVSRCHVVRFKPLPNETVSAYLVKTLSLKKKDADYLAKFSGGSIGLASELSVFGMHDMRNRMAEALSNRQPAERQWAIYELLTEPPSGKAAKEARRATQLKLAVLLSFMLDALFIKLDISPRRLYNDDFVADAFPEMAPERLFEGVDDVLEIDSMIWKNVNLKMAMSCAAASV